MQNRVETETSFPNHVAKNPVYRYCWYSVRSDNRNEVIIVHGRPGSCKSGWALRFAQDMDLRWSSVKNKWVSKFILAHVVFSVKDLIALTTKKMDKGTVIIYDEAGVESDNTSYQEMRSKVLRWVLQTWRSQNSILIMTTPTYGSITTGIKRVTTLSVECFGRKGQKRDKAYSKVMFVQHGGKKGKEYEKYLRYTEIYNGIKVKKKMKDYIFPKPNSIIEAAYDIKKEKQKQEWYGKFSDELKYMKDFLGGKADNESKKIGVMAEEVYGKYRVNLKEFVTPEGKFSPAMVERKLLNDNYNIGSHTLSRVMRLLRADYDEGGFKKPKEVKIKRTHPAFIVS